MEKNQKFALVTGAGAGLGKAIALTLAKEGYTLILTGRRKEKLEEVAQEIGLENSFIIPCDVTKQEEVNYLHTQLLEKTQGKLDILVNNVGGVPAMGTIAEISMEDWSLMIDTNLTSQFLVTQAFLPELRKATPGKIISVTSGMAHFFMKGFGPYSASKAGLEALMKTVAEEEKENQIQVHLFDPENVISEGNPQGEKDPMEMMDKFLKLIS